MTSSTIEDCSLCLPAPHSLVCSIPAKSYPANRIWQIMHGFVRDYKFLMPTLARIPPFKQTKFPFGDVNDWIDSEGLYFFHLSRGWPSDDLSRRSPLLFGGISHWRGSPRKGLKRMRWISSGINLGRWSRWWKRDAAEKFILSVFVCGHYISKFIGCLLKEREVTLKPP